MDDTIKPPPPEISAVSQALVQAGQVRATLLGFIDKIKATTPTGTPPWAILAAPEFLNHVVSLLAFEHSCKLVSRADTRVTVEDINHFLEAHGREWGAFPAAIRRPSMFADLFGVRFIAAMGLPPGALAFVPQAPLEPVVVDASRDAHVDGPAAA